MKEGLREPAPLVSPAQAVGEGPAVVDFGRPNSLGSATLFICNQFGVGSGLCDGDAEVVLAVMTGQSSIPIVVPHQ